MKRIAILGANGYIGRNVTSYLRNLGYSLRLYGQEATSERYPDIYECVDLTKKDEISRIDFECDCFIYLVGINGTRRGFVEYEKFLTINELSLLHFLNACIEHNCRATILYPSTRLVYQSKEGSVNENDQVMPISVYAINKYSCERYIDLYSRCYGLSYCILRLSIPYGSIEKNDSPNQTMGVLIQNALNKGVITLYGDGKQRRTFTSIYYLCEVITKCIDHAGELNGTYNIGGENYSLVELAEYIASISGATIEHVDWPKQDLAIEVMNTVLSEDKLSQRLGCRNSDNIKQWIRLQMEGKPI